MAEFKGHFGKGTPGGGRELVLKTRRRVPARFVIQGRKAMEIDVFGDCLRTDDPELIEQMKLAIRQAEEAYDEEKRLG